MSDTTLALLIEQYERLLGRAIKEVVEQLPEDIVEEKKSNIRSCKYSPILKPLYDLKRQLRIDAKNIRRGGPK